ncbi:MAG: PEGA domain-containing protein [Deltaproteobacteria bacterium]|nr:PEGA domain-containing protein [Deltaproteobacteria bacterium]
MQAFFRLAVVVAVAVLAPSWVAAQPAGDEAKARAQAQSARGQELYEAGRYLEAANAFEEAQTVFPHPNNLFNAAKAYEKLADYDRAAKSYREFLDFYERVNGRLAPEAADVERTITLLREKAYLALPEITIDSDPGGADVSIDEPGKILGQTPHTTHLPEGTHRVFLKKPGFQGIEREFVVRSREPLRMTFAFERERSEGGLRFRVNVRKARIYVDGKVHAVTPFHETLLVPSGPHQILIEKERYSQVARSVEVANNSVQEVNATLYLTSPGFSWRGYVGVTGMALGTATLATALFWARPEANKRFPGESGFDTLKSLTYAGYGVGGALLAGGIGLFVWEFTRKAVEPEDVAAAPAPASAPAVSAGIAPDGSAWIGAVGRF